MAYQIRQQFLVESARFLPKLPKGHPCSRVHGHSFRITLVLAGELQPEGWLIDFNEVEAKAKPVINRIDHCLLNEVPGLENPTSELLCRWIFQQLKPNLTQLIEVSVSETPSTACSYRP